jgi:hypothetical protein
LAPVSGAELVATPNFSVPFDVSKPDTAVDQGSESIPTAHMSSAYSAAFTDRKIAREYRR